MAGVGGMGGRGWGERREGPGQVMQGLVGRGEDVGFYPEGRWSPGGLWVEDGQGVTRVPTWSVGEAERWGRCVARRWASRVVWRCRYTRFERSPHSLCPARAEPQPCMCCVPPGKGRPAPGPQGGRIFTKYLIVAEGHRSRQGHSS